MRWWGFGCFVSGALVVVLAVDLRGGNFDDAAITAVLLALNLLTVLLGPPPSARDRL